MKIRISVICELTQLNIVLVSFARTRHGTKSAYVTATAAQTDGTNHRLFIKTSPFPWRDVWCDQHLTTVLCGSTEKSQVCPSGHWPPYIREQIFCTFSLFLLVNALVAPEIIHDSNFLPTHNSHLPSYFIPHYIKHSFDALDLLFSTMLAHKTGLNNSPRYKGSLCVGDVTFR